MIIIRSSHEDKNKLIHIRYDDYRAGIHVAFISYPSWSVNSCVETLSVNNYG